MLPAVQVDPAFGKDMEMLAGSGGEGVVPPPPPPLFNFGSTADVQTLFWQVAKPPVAVAGAHMVPSGMYAGEPDGPCRHCVGFVSKAQLTWQGSGFWPILVKPVAPDLSHGNVLEYLHQPEYCCCSDLNV